MQAEKVNAHTHAHRKALKRRSLITLAHLGLAAALMPVGEELLRHKARPENSDVIIVRVNPGSMAITEGTNILCLSNVTFIKNEKFWSIRKP